MTWEIPGILTRNSVSAGIFCLLCSVVPVAADQLFVRNRPFHGPVRGSGARMEAQIGALASALGLSITEMSGNWVVTTTEEKPALPEGVVGTGKIYYRNKEIAQAQTIDSFVSVQSFTEGVEGVMRLSATLGTVDVYRNVAAPKATNNRGGLDSLNTWSLTDAEERQVKEVSRGFVKAILGGKPRTALSYCDSEVYTDGMSRTSAEYQIDRAIRWGEKGRTLRNNLILRRRSELPDYPDYVQFEWQSDEDNQTLWFQVKRFGNDWSIFRIVLDLDARK